MLSSMRGATHLQHIRELLGRWRLAPLAGGLVALALLVPWGAGHTGAAADTAGYVGDAVCRGCHAEVAQGWAESAHGKALADPQLPDGFRGCEACHGPGSAHVGTAGKGPIVRLKDADPAQLESVCGKCHSPGNSSPAPGPAIDPAAWKLTAHAGQATSCLTCHRLHGSAPHALTGAADKLCLTCHSQLIDSSSPEATHAPVREGQCTLCHDPHGGQPPSSVRPDLSAQCQACHVPGTAPMTAAHKGYPVAGSDCARCHDPHSSDRAHGYLRKVAHAPFAQGNCQVCHDKAPSLTLHQAAPGLCLTCHPQQSILPEKDADGKPLKAHPPVASGMCLTCHEPHVSDTEGGLRPDPASVCIACHRAIGTQAMAASYKHPPVAKGECLSCHQGHTSAQPALLRTDQNSLCKSCHEQQAMHAHPMGPEAKDPNTGEPVRCTSCHAVHGSDFPSLMPKDESQMCLGCHQLEH
jgi:DmsE family decaheme c-type cytochrome